MLEKLIALFERLVIATETLAGAATPAAGTAPTAPAEGPKPARSRTVKETKSEAPPAAADDLDFLGTGQTAPAKTYERGDVKAALEKLVKKSGQPAAFELFQKVGGVKALNDLPAEKFAAVVEAVEKALAA